jgi:hypothetical protein
LCLAESNGYPFLIILPTDSKTTATADEDL